jgi:hypothetical protein
MPAGNGVQLMMQLTDGSILVQGYNGFTWMKLTPDTTGSYINGTWTNLAPGPVPRLYFASQILQDGRLWILGGEYTGPGLLSNWSNTGEIYDPVTDSWHSVAPYPDQATGCPSLSQMTATLTNGSSQLTAIYPFTTGLQAGWAVTGTGIPANTTIVSVDSSSQITISAPATMSRTASTITFTGHSVRQAGCFGDVPSMLLPGNQILAGNLANSTTFLYDIATDAWSQSGTKIYADQSDEEGWAKMADGTVLTYDLFKSKANPQGSYAEKYDPATHLWSSISPSDGSALGFIPQLSSNALGSELGPLLRLQDGRMFCIGANQHTALYTPSTNTWAAGPDIMGTLNGISSPFGGTDSPAAILPNGHVILAADASASQFTSSGDLTTGSNIIVNIPSTAILQPGWTVSGTGIPTTVTVTITSIDSPTQVHISANATATRTSSIKWGGTFSRPTQLFDFDPNANTINPVSPAIPDARLNTSAVYPKRMLVLPTGQMLFSDASNTIYVYTPDGTPNPALRPVINGIVYNGGGTFTLTGKQLNGQSAGAAYGDDDQMDTNYPIIRMTNASGHVFYARTTDWSNVGVAGGTAPETVKFTLNPALTAGMYIVIVSGAGIQSFPVVLNVTQAEVNKQ